MINLDEALHSIVIGVRFRANFRLEDLYGEIVDEILYSKGSYFGPDVFPAVRAGVNHRELLGGEDTGNSLIINNSNIILELAIGGESNKQSKLKKIEEAFNRQVIIGLAKRFKITQINRVGYIRRYLLNDAPLAQAFIKNTVANLEGVNDINLTFSRRVPTDEALSKKDVNDYDNIIYTFVKKHERDDLFVVAIDYQRYFEPFLEDASQIDFPSYVQSVEKFNVNELREWVAVQYGVQS